MALLYPANAAGLTSEAWMAVSCGAELLVSYVMQLLTLARYNVLFHQ